MDDGSKVIERGVPEIEPLGSDSIYNLLWQQSVFLNSAQQDHIKSKVKFGIVHGRRKLVYRERCPRDETFR